MMRDLSPEDKSSSQFAKIKKEVAEKNAEMSAKDRFNLTEKETFRLFDGNTAKRENVIGLCHSLAHRGWISKSLLKKHRCLEKNCPSLEKANMEYWNEIEARQEMKKHKRRKCKEAAKKKQFQEDLARSYFARYEDIYLTRVELDGGVFRICYVSRKYTDISDAIKELAAETGKRVSMKCIKGNPETMSVLFASNSA